MASHPSDRVIEVAFPAPDEWPLSLTDTVVNLTKRLQTALVEKPQAPVLLSLVCPENGIGSVVDSTIEACRGLAQSVALEVPTTRCSLVITTSSQVHERTSTAALFLGPNGGFIAGSTFDLRGTR